MKSRLMNDEIYVHEQAMIAQ